MNIRDKVRYGDIVGYISQIMIVGDTKVCLVGIGDTYTGPTFEMVRADQLTTIHDSMNQRDVISEMWDVFSENDRFSCDCNVGGHGYNATDDDYNPAYHESSCSTHDYVRYRNAIKEYLT